MKNRLAYAFHVETQNAYVDYIPGCSTLVVSFESGGKPFVRKDKKRLGWGKNFFLDMPWSILWVKPKIVDWYRSKSTIDYFEFLSSSGFFKKFDRVVWVGGSMGGYAALAYSTFHAGSTVIALNPQTTLCQKLVPWEKRKIVEEGLKQDWSGRLVDGAKLSKSAKNIYLIYDPWDVNDRKHADRVDSEKKVELKIPFIGHSVPKSMQSMGILKKVIIDCVEQEMDENKFYDYAKKRKELAVYYERLIVCLIRKKHFFFAEKIFNGCMEKGVPIKLDKYPFLKKFHFLKMESF